MEYLKWLKNKDLEYRDGELFFGEHCVSSLGEKFGTPTFIINESTIRKRYDELHSILKTINSNMQINFAVKANNNLHVLRLLDSLGGHFDVVSSGEAFLCKAAGIQPGKILQTSNNWTDEELEYAVKNHISINLDAPSQIHRLNNIVNKYDAEKPIVSFRVNPIFGAGHHSHTITAGEHVKFGILEDKIVEVYKQALNAGFKRLGIHIHIGSGILNAAEFEKAIQKYYNIIQKIISELDIIFEFIDFGGGLGIPYKPDQDPINVQGYANLIKKYHEEFTRKLNLGNPKFIFEPGRFLTAESCIIVSKINTIKKRSNKIFIGCDTGFNTLIRPAFYGSYHHIIPTQDIESYMDKNVDIVGQICESGDVLGRDRHFPQVKEGDYICIMDTGAYGYSMSSNYNARPRAMELWIHNNQPPKIVRTRENFTSLLENQVISLPSEVFTQSIPFIKMHGTGNDYIYLDFFKYTYPEINYFDLARKISHRRFGVGGDGLVLIIPKSTNVVRMRMFNTDGSESEMCGNAIRCIGGYCYGQGYVNTSEFFVETEGGIKKIIVLGPNKIRVNMGSPILEGLKIPTSVDRTPVIDHEISVNGFSGKFTAVSMGNPHAVYFLNDISSLNLEKIGSLLEHHPFFPERVNSEFVEILNRNEVNFRVWERGSGETWACGTGASAALVAGVLKGVLDNKVLFHLKGGDLTLETNEDLTEVWKTGPWEFIGEGMYRYSQNLS
ncbi:MAG: diaminopimelate decarboxylase [Candidatus Lokiarchaeota archaeon]|nr:diaminopimelate decarboxylase [Candidatus Lokiarchaeota archaeon]